MRTLSKAYGLAGLRIGYAVAAEPLVRRIDAQRQRFNTSCIAQAAAIAAIGDREHLALVTGAGANGGIGHAIALGYARAGARLAICDIDDAGLARTAGELSALGALASAGLFDISDEAQVEALFASIDRAARRIDILVNVPFAFPRRTA